VFQLQQGDLRPPSDLLQMQGRSVLLRRVPARGLRFPPEKLLLLRKGQSPPVSRYDSEM
jgi:hypothetical protein